MFNLGWNRNFENQTQNLSTCFPKTKAYERYSFRINIIIWNRIESRVKIDMPSVVNLFPSMLGVKGVYTKKGAVSLVSIHDGRKIGVPVINCGKTHVNLRFPLSIISHPHSRKHVRHFFCCLVGKGEQLSSWQLSSCWPCPALPPCNGTPPTCCMSGFLTRKFKRLRRQGPTPVIKPVESITRT